MAKWRIGNLSYEEILELLQICKYWLEELLRPTKLVLHQGSNLSLESSIERIFLKGEKVRLRLKKYKLSGMTEQ